MAININLTHEMLKKHIKTGAEPKDIAKALSLCGPSVERLHQIGNDYVYEFEVTVNRVDMASSFGIAQEANAILPRFGYSVKLNKPIESNLYPSKKFDLKLEVLTKKVTLLAGILVSKVDAKKKDGKLTKSLELIGEKSNNYIVDATNIATFTYGHPVHAFDWDKIKDGKLSIREARKNESIVLLDGRNISLKGGEVVIEHSGILVDLPGIMGGKLSAVDENTKNILLLIEKVDPMTIRKTSLDHALRTHAAVLNEKNPAWINGLRTLNEAASLITNVCGEVMGTFEWGEEKTTKSTIRINHEKVVSTIGVEIDKQEVASILTSLGFEVDFKADSYQIVPPITRRDDVQIEEDIIEEIARIYGYFNIPPVIMSGSLPKVSSSATFSFESKLASTLSLMGGYEVVSLSMTTNKQAGENAINILNPLGDENAFMKTTLLPKLTEAVMDNSRISTPFFLYEIANVYKKNPKNKSISEEITLAIVFSGYSQRNAQGVLDAISKKFHIEKMPDIRFDGKYYMWECEVETLLQNSKPYVSYVPIPTTPAQIEDLTIHVPTKNKVGDVIEAIYKTSKLIEQVTLMSEFERNFTFRVLYRSKEKNLTDTDVSKVRNDILANVNKNLISGRINS